MVKFFLKILLSIDVTAVLVEGVLLAVKDTIPSLLLPTSIPNLEILTVQIGIAQLALILCLVYIPPNSTAFTCEPLFTHLSELANKYDSLLILGCQLEYSISYFFFIRFIL